MSPRVRACARGSASEIAKAHACHAHQHTKLPLSGAKEEVSESVRRWLQQQSKIFACRRTTPLTHRASGFTMAVVLLNTLEPSLVAFAFAAGSFGVILIYFLFYSSYVLGTSISGSYCFQSYATSGFILTRIASFLLPRDNYFRLASLNFR